MSYVIFRWLKLISESALTMKKLTLNYDNFASHSTNLRNYHSLLIQHVAGKIDKDKGLYDILSSIQDLKMSNCWVDDLDELETFLNYIPLIRKIAFTRVRLVRLPALIRHKPLPGKKLTLKKLSLIQTDHYILKFLSHFQVLTLQITDANNYTCRESLVNFLMQQKKLEALTMEELIDRKNVLFDEPIENVHFKLKFLSILFSRSHNDKFYENFKGFMRHHCDSLTRLKIDGSIPNTIYKCIVTQFWQLEDLEINVGELPQDVSFYGQLKMNERLTKLTLNGTIKRSNIESVCAILGFYRKIEILVLADTDEHVSNHLFHMLSVRLRNLKILSIFKFHHSFTYNINLPSLETFSMKVLTDVNQWKKFIIHNGSINTLKVGWIQRDLFTQEIIREIISQPNIKHLEFGGRFTVTKRIYDVIKINYKNLRTLKLIIGNYDEVQKLKFVFPLKISQWRNECQYFDEGFDREPLND